MAHRWTVSVGTIYHSKKGWRRVTAVLNGIVYYKNKFDGTCECDIESFKRWRRRAKARKARALQPKGFQLEPSRRPSNRKTGSDHGLAGRASATRSEGAGRPRLSRPDGVSAVLPLVSRDA